MSAADHMEALTKAMSFAGGALVGFGVAYMSLENRFAKKYEEMAASNRRAYEYATLFDRKPEGPDVEEGQDPLFDMDLNESAHLIDSPDNDIKVVEGKLIAVSADEEIGPGGGHIVDVKKNPYHTPVTPVQKEPEKPKVTAPIGVVNDFGTSFIEEEEFFDEDDGRVKNRVDFMLVDNKALFIMDGDELQDWDQHLGRTIVSDFWQHVPPGAEPVLYVRNHRNNEDYEVVRVEP